MPSLLSSSSSASTHVIQPCLELQLPAKPNVHNGAAAATTTWGSLYALSHTNEASFEAVNKTNASVTTAKKKTLVSKKNLDMCTETLGCETGVFYTTDDYKRDDLSLKRSGRSALFEAEERKRRAREDMMLEKSSRRVESMAEFPPPLSTISGEGRFHLTSKRSHGRLVVFSIKPSVMHAERSDGCLRLRIVSGCNCSKSGNINAAMIVGEKTEEEVMKAMKEVEGNEEREEGGVCVGVVGEETKGTVFKDNVEKETEVAKYAKIGGRCKEEGKGKSRGNRREKWEAERAFWVATS